MKIGDLKGQRMMDFDFEEIYKNYKLRQSTKVDDEAELQEAALKKVEEAKDANVKTVLEVMDRHN